MSDIKTKIAESVAELLKEIETALPVIIYHPRLLQRSIQKIAEAVVTLKPLYIPYTKVNIPDPNIPGSRIVGFRISETDIPYGEHGISEPLEWLNNLYYIKPNE